MEPFPNHTQSHQCPHQTENAFLVWLVVLLLGTGVFLTPLGKSKLRVPVSDSVLELKGCSSPVSGFFLFLTSLSSAIAYNTLLTHTLSLSHLSHPPLSRLSHPSLPPLSIMQEHFPPLSPFFYLKSYNVYNFLCKNLFL